MKMTWLDVYASKKAVLINASGKIKRDLSYIFKDVEFNILESLTGQAECNIPVIDCDIKRNSDKNEKRLIENRCDLHEYIKKANYLYSVFDNRKIAIFGTGYIAMQCVQKWSDLYNGISIDCFLDNNPQKWNETFCDRKILSLESLNNIKDYYIIICVQENGEIVEQLESYGLERTKDYIGYNTAFCNLGEALEVTLLDTRKHDFICKRPFGFADIIGENVYLCCPASLKRISIGNLYEQTFDQVWNSMYAQIIRLSILNGTYSFCDYNFCDRYDLHKIQSESLIEENDYQEITADFPKDLIVGVDPTCNLSCPSCRKNVYVADKELQKKKWKVACELLDCIDNRVEKLWISGDGEPFFSPLYDRMLCDDRCIERDKISILSNGTLLDEKHWSKYLERYHDIDIVLSIDGATKEVYEKLRRGGKFEEVYHNLQFLGKLRKTGRINALQINYVLQADNIAELKQMIAICKENHVDTLKILKLYDYGMYPNDEFEKMSVVDEKNKCIKPEYQKYVTQEIVNEKILDWSFMAPYVGTKSKPSLFLEGYSLW